MRWEESLRNFEWLRERRQTFRHGTSIVAASSIASQYYCEQKVEMEHIHGEVETEAKLEGGRLHEELIRMRKTTLDDIISGIKKEEICVASFPIFAKLPELVLAGVPDAIVFLRGIPAFVIELKTTRGDTSRLWKDQLVQARVYGLILEEMGFNCSHLKLVVARLQRNGEMSEEYKVRFLRSVIQNLLKARGASATRNEGFTIHLIGYNRQEALTDVNWAAGYWLSSRQPIPTRKVAKCRSCEYQQVCPCSLVKLHQEIVS